MFVQQLSLFPTFFSADSHSMTFSVFSTHASRHSSALTCVSLSLQPNCKHEMLSVQTWDIETYNPWQWPRSVTWIHMSGFAVPQRMLSVTRSAIRSERLPPCVWVKVMSLMRQCDPAGTWWCIYSCSYLCFSPRNQITWNYAVTCCVSFAC